MIVPLISCLKNDSIYCRKYPKWNFDISIYSIHSANYSEYDVQFTSASFWRLDELLERRKDSRERCHAAIFPTGWVQPTLIPCEKCLFFGQRWFSLVEEITVEQNPRNCWLQPRFSQISCFNASWFFFLNIQISQVPKCHIWGWISPCFFSPGTWPSCTKCWRRLVTLRGSWWRSWKKWKMGSLCLEENMEIGSHWSTETQRVLNLNIEDDYSLEGIVGDLSRILSDPFPFAKQQEKGMGWSGGMLHVGVFSAEKNAGSQSERAIFRDRWRNSGGRSPSKYAGDWHERGPRKALLHMWVSWTEVANFKRDEHIDRCQWFSSGYVLILFSPWKKVATKRFFLIIGGSQLPLNHQQLVQTDRLPIWS